MYCRWGSLDATVVQERLTGRAGITMQTGVDPSLISLSVSPPTGGEADVPRDGSLWIGDGDDPDAGDVAGKGDWIRLAGCRVADGDITHTQSTRTCDFVVRDFRWQWALAPLVSAEYNRRDRSEKIVGTRKSARDIATWLYSYLPTPSIKGGTDCHALPADEYPHVTYDHARPAEELQALCDRYGVLICPAAGQTTDNPPVDAVGKIVLAKQGSGRAVSGDPATVVKEPLRVVDVPATLRMVGGRNLEQRSVVLEAVGWDPDAGEYKALSADGDDALPYKPGWGWDLAFAESTSDDEQRKAALATVWRAYRIPATVTLGTEVLDRSAAAERMLDHLVQKGKVDLEERYLDAYVTGAYGTEECLNDANLYQETSTKRVKVGFRMDQEHGVIIFNETVLDFDDDFFPVSPTLTLVCAWEAEHFSKDFTLATGIDGLMDKVVNEQVRLEYIRAADGTTFTHLNETAANAAAYREAVAYARQWKLPAELATKTFPGLLMADGPGNPVLPDGAVEQVSWELGEGGPATTVSWGREHDVALPPRKVRRKAKDLNKQARRERAAVAGAPAVDPDQAVEEEAERGSIHLEEI